ncbi:Glycosyltransferase of PMT family [Halorhabdus sp. SVX81]|uniref:ArnT family glycosyltransferase n=1 Tax=Halorhabdus sp. SVX81 TaxID=2978283 RepID=UPI0023D9CDA6|nr:glycosyltransferase family 39 protein [Halorhabdus sp. SVX81]WEL18662.1 Glycosyltransferase of PMT family [Halorhabdus sp. SVX81]
MDRRRFRLATLALALLGALAVWLVSTNLFPYHSLNHDEGVYLQQAAMLLEGKLTLTPPVEGVFRPWFFVESEGFYPKYNPVPAGLFALGELLGGYRLALPAIAAGILAGVTGVVNEVFDRRTGLLAAIFVLASPLFLLDTATFLPYAPTTLLNLAFAYAYLRADRTDDWRWAAAAGVAIGLAFFARPYTAVLFAAPFVAHACWTLARDWRTAIPRQAATATLGLVGVGLTLAYNAAVTGSPLTFPYEAFAPLDGLGFGHRELLNHGVEYTPGLALQANWNVHTTLVDRWIAGGIVGAALAVAGLGVAARRGLDARQATLAAVGVSVPVGNLYFWGNYNLLGDLDAAGDGLIASLGPYYHFDLLVPTAAFGAVAALAAFDALRAALTARFERRTVLAALAAITLVSTLVLGGITAGGAGPPVERNADVTDTYERAYAPFEPEPPANAVVLTPTPYGPWLNHPFQALRNDPGYDGRTVYAMADRPFAIAEAFPDRDLYRFGFRGVWDPLGDSPEAARLQRVRERSGESVTLNASVGLPERVTSATVTVETDDGTAHYVPRETGDELQFRLVIGDTVRAVGLLEAGSEEQPTIEGREDVDVTVFADDGIGGFEYRLSVPVEAGGGQVRALTPRVEYCFDAQACGGAATYVPEESPDGVFVRTELRATNETQEP